MSKRFSAFVRIRPDHVEEGVFTDNPSTAGTTATQPTGVPRPAATLEELVALAGAPLALDEKEAA